VFCSLAFFPSALHILTPPFLPAPISLSYTTHDSVSALLFGIIPKMSLSEEGKKKSNYMKMMDPAAHDAHGHH